MMEWGCAGVKGGGENDMFFFTSFYEKYQIYFQHFRGYFFFFHFM